MAKKEVAVGIDLGGTNTVFGFVDREGNILGEDRLKTSQYDEIEVFVAALYEKIIVTGKKLGRWHRGYWLWYWCPHGKY